MAVASIKKDEVLIRLPSNAFLRLFYDPTSTGVKSFAQELVDQLLGIFQSEPLEQRPSPWACSVACLMRLQSGNQDWRVQDPFIAAYIDSLPSKVPTPDGYTLEERSAFVGTTANLGAVDSS